MTLRSFQVRVEPELLARLREEAQANGRTIRAEVYFRLFGSAPDKGAKPGPKTNGPAHAANCPCGLCRLGRK